MAAMGLYDAQIYDHVSFSITNSFSKIRVLIITNVIDFYQIVNLFFNLEILIDVSGQMDFMENQTILLLLETQESDSCICI